VRTFLKAVILLLTAMLLLAVLALVFLQEYIVYSADGIRLELPFGKVSQPPVPTGGDPSPAVSEPVVVATPEVVKPEWLHAVALPREALYDGTAAQRLEAAGGNAAIFDMKASSGSLGYVSALPLAISAKVSSGTRPLTQPSGPSTKQGSTPSPACPAFRIMTCPMPTAPLPLPPTADTAGPIRRRALDQPHQRYGAAICGGGVR
jgi:hypothetical protein